MDTITIERVATAIPAKRRLKFGLKRLALAGLALALATGGVGYGHYWWTVDRFIESTDDAYDQRSDSLQIDLLRLGRQSSQLPCLQSFGYATLTSSVPSSSRRNQPAATQAIASQAISGDAATPIGCATDAAVRSTKAWPEARSNAGSWLAVDQHPVDELRRNVLRIPDGHRRQDDPLLCDGRRHELCEQVIIRHITLVVP